MLLGKKSNRFIKNKTKICALLCSSIYNEGVRRNMTEGHRTPGYIKKFGYEEEVHINAQEMSKMFNDGLLRPLKNHEIQHFIPTEVLGDKGVLVMDGVASIDGFNTLGFFVERDDGDGVGTMHIVFRGTELEVGLLRSIHQYFFGDYMRLARHYEQIAPVIENAMAYAKEKGMHVTFSGHSLGGAMAQIAVAEQDKKLGAQADVTAVTFGSPGSYHLNENVMKKMEGVLKWVDPLKGSEKFGFLREVVFNVASLMFNVGSITAAALIPSKEMVGEKVEPRILLVVHPDDPVPKIGRILFEKEGLVLKNRRSIEYKKTKGFWAKLKQSFGSHSMDVYAHVARTEANIANSAMFRRSVGSKLKLTKDRASGIIYKQLYK